MRTCTGCAKRSAQCERHHKDRTRYRLRPGDQGRGPSEHLTASQIMAARLWQLDYGS